MARRVSPPRRVPRAPVSPRACFAARAPFEPPASRAVTFPTTDCPRVPFRPPRAVRARRGSGGSRSLLRCVISPRAFQGMSSRAQSRDLASNPLPFVFPLSGFRPSRASGRPEHGREAGFRFPSCLTPHRGCNGVVRMCWQGPNASGMLPRLVTNRCRSA
jgi:hypothetical protein